LDSLAAARLAAPNAAEKSPELFHAAASLPSKGKDSLRRWTHGNHRGRSLEIALEAMALAAVRAGKIKKCLILIA
jgi:hypothetical protein